jgi:hypothetical protein
MTDIGISMLNFAIILVVISVILDRYFNFSEINEHYLNNSPNIDSYYTPNITSMPIQGVVANKGTKSFGNFGKFGDIPIMQYCSECRLHGNCASPEYTRNGNDKNVCLKCGDFLQNNRINLNKPIYVGAKTAGRGRQCRIINF